MVAHIDNTDNVADDATLELLGGGGVTTAVVGDTTYLFVTGEFDNGVSVFAVTADGTLANVDTVDDSEAAALLLRRAAGVTTAVVGGSTYLFVAGFGDFGDSGVSVFSVAADGALTNVDNVSDDATLEIDGAADVTTAVVGGTTYLFVNGQRDDGLSVFAVAADGTLTNVGNVTDDTTLQLSVPMAVTTAVVGGTTYLFVAGHNDDGISEFAVAADGTLTNLQNVTAPPFRVDGPTDMTTAVIDGVTYLFVGSDEGVTSFSIGANGTLSIVDNAEDPAQQIRAGAVSAAVVDGNTYLFATDFFGDVALNAFAVAPDGTLALSAQVSDNAILQLAGPRGVATAVVGGTSYLFVAAGTDDNGVSVFALGATVPALGDVLWQHTDGTAAVASQDLPVVSDNWQIAGTGDFDGDGDDDILWRHEQGSVVAWEIEDGAVLENHDVAVAGTSWHIRGTGDFDGDGDADIPWHHDQGQVVTWEMEDSAFVASHSLAAAGFPWRITGTGDFDGDGDADILWRHDEGQVVTWEMEDGAFVVNHDLSQASDSFHIAGTGDFDGDGDADILWLHEEGQVVTWEMEDGAFVVNHDLGNVGPAWQIAGTEDFDSDGDADILWRHDQGAIVRLRGEPQFRRGPDWPADHGDRRVRPVVTILGLLLAQSFRRTRVK
jgi:6-phosphogluconolactonase (cycloisomerase 2 family)